MRPRGMIVAVLLLAAACGTANPPAASEGSLSGGKTGAPSSSSSGASAGDDADASDDPTADASDAGADALDAADAFDGFYPPPPSECNPQMTIGAPSLTTTGARFAGITRDELTIAWTAPNQDGKLSLFVAERDTPNEGFGTPQTISTDAATDGVALADDGLSLYAVSADHRSFVVYDRADRDADFAVGDDSIFDPVIEALGADEQLGDPVFVNSGVVFLYSVYGKSADTMRLANRISAYASYYPTYTLSFDQLRASGSARRRPTGTGDDFQVIFYWDEVSQTEKLARLNGTEMILSVKDLGAHPWAQVNGDCTRIYFGNENVFTANAR